MIMIITITCIFLFLLIKVDHKLACVRDESLSFDKELLNALQSKLKILESDDQDAVETTDKPVNNIKGHPRILPPLLLPSTGNNVKKHVKGTSSELKERGSIRRYHSRSTLPDALPKLIVNKADVERSTIDDNSKSSAATSGDKSYVCSSMKTEGNNDPSMPSDQVEEDQDNDSCRSPVVIIRSESEARERLADIMDFECQNDDLDNAFIDDKNLQRAVVLRNHAYHPQAPPSSPEQDVNEDRLHVSDEAVSRMESNNRSSAEHSDYWIPTSPVDRLGTTLEEINSLIDVHEQMFLQGTDGKPVKSVRFAELPPKYKGLSKSKSDQTGNKMASEEWNNCFLVAVGRNRAIRKELKHSRRKAQSLSYLTDDAYDDENDDEMGNELIEREMKRYIHWLRHDRATEQHRWLSSNISQKNIPITTHHIEPVNPTIPKLSVTSLSARVAKAIGLYCVLPKAEPHVSGVLSSRSVRFPRVPVLPPIAGGSNETVHSRTFTGEVKGVPISKKKKRLSNGRRY